MVIDSMIFCMPETSACHVLFGHQVLLVHRFSAAEVADILLFGCKNVHEEVPQPSAILHSALPKILQQQRLRPHLQLLKPCNLESAVSWTCMNVTKGHCRSADGQSNGSLQDIFQHLERSPSKESFIKLVATKFCIVLCTLSLQRALACSQMHQRL